MTDLPSGNEIRAALTAYAEAVEESQAANRAVMLARERVVELLHKAGLHGFVL